MPVLENEEHIKVGSSAYLEAGTVDTNRAYALYKHILRQASTLVAKTDLADRKIHSIYKNLISQSIFKTQDGKPISVFIANKYGKKYVPAQTRVYKSKDNAQDAHEAIRPADVTLEPDAIKKYLSSGQYKLYKLIWSRYVASQMSNAEFDTVTSDIQAGDHIFRVSGYVVKFDGYMALYKTDDNEYEDEDNRIPDLKVGQTLSLSELSPVQRFTEPPARYTEATLIKFLEEKGIGRPSTFAQIISTIISRGYVQRQGHSLVPTSLGDITTQLMIDNFPDIVDYKFTAQMEDTLDGIADGNNTFESVLSGFYKDFKVNLEKAEEKVKDHSFELPAEQTDIICDKCVSIMIVKNGRFGKFAACPNYPECKNTKPIDAKKAPTPEPEITDQICESCGGKLVIRSGKFGQFYACESFPKCKFTRQITKETGASCPKCSSTLISKRGKNNFVFYSCEKYPECDFSTWDIPLKDKCPECNSTMFFKKSRNQAYCINKEKCGYSAPYTLKDDEQ
jgi:DNA topoisomerase-1